MSLLSVAQRLGRYRWFARFGRAVFVPADRFVARLTKGKVVALGVLPSLTLTTTGRKSGQPRTQLLAYVPDGDGFAVIGSNWGQTHHPAWSGNLLAHPDAVVNIKGRVVRVHADVATGAERERLWELLLRTWPAYQAYAERAGRELRIFRLNPAPENRANRKPPADPEPREPEPPASRKRKAPVRRRSWSRR